MISNSGERGTPHKSVELHCSRGCLCFSVFVILYVLYLAYAQRCSQRRNAPNENPSTQSEARGRCTGAHGSDRPIYAG